MGSRVVVKIIDCKQQSPEWLAARLGKVTASEIDALVSPELKIRTGKGPQTYLYRKVAEKLLGYMPESATTFTMAQGTVIEAEAIPWYSFEHNVQVDRVGFCESDDGRIGFSPDGLIGEDGGIEVKSPQPAKAVEYLLENEVPVDYRLQVQFSLYVSGRKWWKFISYSRQLPALVIHVEPHAETFKAFDMALKIFHEKFDAKLAQVAKMKAEYEAPLNAEHDKAIEAMRANTPDGELPGEKWLREKHASEVGK